MKIALALLCLTFLSSPPWAAENPSSPLLRQGCENLRLPSERSLSETVCLQNDVYELKYDQKLRRIILFFDDKGLPLQQFSKGRDPALVGADKVIGFLPEKFQVYKKSNILLYISSIRTNSGTGGGQCGAGSEIYLNFLSVGKPEPQVSSRILIGSCDYSIELDNQSIPDGEIGDISAEGNKLLLHFLNYKKMDGSPVATVAPDRKNLVFKN